MIVMVMTMMMMMTMMTMMTMMMRMMMMMIIMGIVAGGGVLVPRMLRTVMARVKVREYLLNLSIPPVAAAAGCSKWWRVRARSRHQGKGCRGG
jgi:hypothetical protein